MTRFLTLFFILVSFLFSQEYPQHFKQLSTPLFDSLKPLSKLCDIENINRCSKDYINEIEKIKKLGYHADVTQDKQEIKKYLTGLRGLQKKYDYILNQIHKNINNAIDEDDYKLFLNLTKYEFDGLLKSRALFNKSLIYYKKNNSIEKSKFFEKKIKYKKLELATTQEFFNIVSTSTYNSLKKDTTKKKVSLEAIDVGNYIDVYIKNLNPYSVTVKVKELYNNLDFDKSVKKIFSLKSGEKQKYIRLYKQKGALSYSYSYSYSWIIGSIDAVHDDDYIYRLPYAKGSSHVVTQGFNGKATHKGHSQYAIDFGMPVGTKIYASRDGVVVKSKENSNRGGYDKKFSSSGNYITIEHSDSTFATYYHLKKNGVVVNIGQKVKRGDFIGYSGNTGYSSGPHLHLAVFKADSSTTTKTIPIKLLSQKGIIDVPKRGIKYIAK